MNVLTTTIARWLFALPLLGFAMVHFMNTQMLTAMVPLPGKAFWVYLTGVGLVLAAISFIIKRQTKLAGILLGIMLLIFAFGAHLPALLGGDQGQMGPLLKAISMAGAAFWFAGTIEKDTDVTE